MAELGMATYKCLAESTFACTEGPQEISCKRVIVRVNTPVGSFELSFKGFTTNHLGFPASFVNSVGLNGICLINDLVVGEQLTFARQFTSWRMVRDGLELERFDIPSLSFKLNEVNILQPRAVDKGVDNLLEYKMASSDDQHCLVPTGPGFGLSKALKFIAPELINLEYSETLDKACRR